jgi:hypothetical protein
MLLAAAFLVIQIHAAVRAKPAAIAAANHFHGDREVHLLGENVREEHPIAFEEPDVSFVQIQLRFVIIGDRSDRTVKEVEIAADFFNDRIETPRAHQFQPGVEFAGYANLPFNQLRSGPDLERFHLTHFRGMQIERSWGVGPADAGLVEREFMNI